ncbi:MAG: recombination-associated protein RdgC [Lentisphaerae bacterium]|nr:recombination-associated protein RdgC [Lentisphaerota bacterium]
MSFERGNVSVTIFRIPESLPENAIELFAAKAAKKLDDIPGDDVSVGWTSGRNLLELNINEATAKLGGYIYLNLRIAQRKIPGGAFNAECRKQELDYMTMNKMEFVPGKVRREIKKDFKEKALMKIEPQISGIPFVIDTNAHLLYLGATSPRKIDTFLAYFHDTFQIEPVQMCAGDMMSKLFKDALPEVKFAKFAPRQTESERGRDFLTWLWYFSEEKNGHLNLENYGDSEIMIEGPLTFAQSDEAEGSRETVVRKGNPLRSAEAKTALDTGKKLKKAKFLIARGKEVWKGTFDVGSFTFSSLSLPEGEKLLDADSMFAERVNYLHVFHKGIQGYFAIFAITLASADWPQEQKLILEWSENRHTC